MNQLFNEAMAVLATGRTAADVYGRAQDWREKSINPDDAPDRMAFHLHAIANMMGLILKRSK